MRRRRCRRRRLARAAVGTQPPPLAANSHSARRGASCWLASPSSCWQRGDVTRVEHDVTAPAAIAVQADGKPPIVVQPFEDARRRRRPRRARGHADGGDLHCARRSRAPRRGDEASGDASSAPRRRLCPDRQRPRDGWRGQDHGASSCAPIPGRRLWSAAYDEPRRRAARAADQRHIARRSRLVAEPYGPIFEAELERMRANAHELRSPTRDCVLRVLRVSPSARRSRAREALECFELATMREPENAEAWAGLSLLFTDASAHGYGDRQASAAPLERAREPARRAMDIDGENLHANLALGQRAVLQRRRFPGRGRTRARGPGPTTPRPRLIVGAMFIVTGETARGRALVASAPSSGRRRRRAVTHASSALAALREQRYRRRARVGAAHRFAGLGDWASSCSPQRRRSAGRTDLAVRARSAHPRARSDDREVVTRGACGGGASSRCSPASSNAGSRQPRVNGRRRDGSLRLAVRCAASSSIRLCSSSVKS